MLSYEDKGKMGPFEGQMFVGDQGHSKIMRVSLEKIQGVYQGAVFPFREGFSSGILRMNWGSDGSMFVGMTSRGWGSTGKELFGLQRLEWNGQIPFEIKTIHAQADGFELEFTQPVEEKTALKAASYNLTSFTYKYHHNYGSPAINQANCPIKAITLSADKMKVRLVVDSLREGYIHEVKAEGIRSTDRFALLHNYGYYTLNKIPEGEKMKITPANIVQSDEQSIRHEMPMGNAKISPAVQTSTKAAPANSVKRLTKQPASWTNGPDRTIVIGTNPGLKFDIENITVKAGTKVKLTFKNNDDMLHNIVFTTPGSASEIGEMALKMGLNGERLNYVPFSPRILYHTILLRPNESDTIYFTVPDKMGEYQYVCTYPGHYLVMKGILKVVAR